MRTWHRWIGLTLGIVMLFVGATGVLIQGFVIADDMGWGGKAPVETSTAAPAPGNRAQSPRSPAKRWEGFVKHLHSGESFGPIGTALSMASGFALFFFAFSGMWMYWQMWRRRAASHRRGLFWRR
jgi:uncharacterized iron-regulated membrane protein